MSDYDTVFLLFLVPAVVITICWIAVSLFMWLGFYAIPIYVVIFIGMVFVAKVYSTRMGNG